MSEARPVQVERVRAEVRAAARLRGEPSTAEPATVEEPEAPSERPPLTRGGLVPVLAVALVGLLSGDMALSLLTASAVIAAVTLHRLAAGERVGFGDGFVAFRADNSWPRGVQEDDDFHWTWAPDDGRPTHASPPATR